MTVKEYIKYLKTLDQDNHIWVCYDGGCSWFPPIPDEQAECSYRDGIIQPGDYIINAG